MLVLACLASGARSQEKGSWTTGSPMPSSRTEVAGAAVGDQIFIVGGYHGERDLEIYDPAKDAWKQGAPFPHPVHHAAAVGVQGKFYVFGGYENGWTPSAKAYVYDPLANQWQRLPDLPSPRGSPAAADR
jgi:N-acetylneuraminic acid mutarotase